MSTIGDALARGVDHHNAGQLASAEAIYRAILAQQPAHPDALRLLGALTLQSGRATEAVTLLEQAVALVPHNVDFQSDLAAACIAASQPERAAAAAQAAIAKGSARAV